MVDPTGHSPSPITVSAGPPTEACSWCGEPIDTTLPYTDARSFTADHPIALANGGALLGQVLEPTHRHCNAMKGASVVIDSDEWGAS